MFFANAVIVLFFQVVGCLIWNCFSSFVEHGTVMVNSNAGQVKRKLVFRENTVRERENMEL